MKGGKRKVILQHRCRTSPLVSKPPIRIQKDTDIQFSLTRGTVLYGIITAPSNLYLIFLQYIAHIIIT